MFPGEGATEAYDRILSEEEEPPEDGGGCSLSGCLLFLFAGIALAAAALIVTLILLFGGGTSPAATLGAKCEKQIRLSDSPTLNPSDPSSVAEGEIPDHYLKAYKEAGQKFGMDWAVLAAVGFTETRHGEGGKKNTCISSSAGAQGPMQFMPYVWPQYATDANGDGEKDPCNYQDAIFAAAKKLTSQGAPENYREALYHYNPKQEYINKVMAKAEEYRESGGDPNGGDTSPQTTPSQSAGDGPMMERVAETTGQPSNSGGTGNPPSGWSMVDSERRLDYDVSNTKYAGVFEEAAAEWDKLGGVSLQRSQSPSDTDVTVVDEHIPGFAVGFTTSARGGIIKLEPAGMDEGDRAYRKTIAVHELGHALGFDHTMGTGEQSIMNYNNMYQYTAPTPFDVERYHKVWGGSGSASAQPVSSDSGVPKECIEAGMTPTKNVSMDGGSTDDVAGKELGVPGGTITNTNHEYNPDYPLHGGYHQGADVQQSPGTPGYAWTKGEVVDSCSGCDPGGFLNYNVVRYDTADGPYTAVYGHISSSSVLPAGTSFKKGEAIANIGPKGTGCCGGAPHFHISVWQGDIGHIGSYDNDLDPVAVFNRVAGDGGGGEKTAAVEKRPWAPRSFASARRVHLRSGRDKSAMVRLKGV